MATSTPRQDEGSGGPAREQRNSETNVKVNDACSSHSGKPTAETVVDEVSNTTADEDSDPSASPEGNKVIQYPSGVKFWLLMFDLGAVICLSAIDMSIVATAVPRITDEFHTVADVGWYSVAFRLCQCSFQFLFGKAYKVFPIKDVFLLANLFSALGSVLCATAVSSTMLVVGRAVAGVGTAGLGAGGLVMLVQSTPLDRRPVFLGLWAAIEGTSTVAGPLLGGAITQTVGWRWCFWINLPIGAVTLLLTYFCFSDASKANDAAYLGLKKKIQQLDPVSNLILILDLTCLFLALSWGGVKYSWDSGEVIGLLVIFAILAVAFIYNQFRRGDAAVLPIRVIKIPTVIASFIFVTCANSAGNVLEYYLPIYYQIVRGYTPGQSGSLMLPILIAATAGAIGSGLGTSACGHYAPFLVFASLAMPISAGLITTFDVDTSLTKIILYTGLSGLGYGVGSTGAGLAVQTVLPDTDISLAMSVLLFGAGLGPAVMIAIAQVIFTSQLLTNLGGLVPGLDRTSIENNGLTELTKHVSPDRVKDVLVGIDHSVTRTYYLVIALSCVLLFACLAMEWRSVKDNRPEQEQDGDSERTPLTQG